MNLPLVAALTVSQAFVLAALVHPGNGAKILFVVGNVNSHVMFFVRFADDLARLGHVTELIVPANARRPDDVAANRTHPNFTYTS